MEKLFMSAGIVTTIVLCLVGIIKIPFCGFKKKHPKWYKAVFTMLSFLLSIGLSILDEVYILGGRLLSIDFAMLICVVFTGVFIGYDCAYEGLGLKELSNKIIEKVKEARTIAVNKKAIKYLNKIEDIEMAMNYLQEKKNNQNREV